MSKTVKVTTVGDSIGIILPKAVLARLHIRKGDTLYVTDTPGGVQLTRGKPEFVRTIETSQRVMRQYRNALRKLAE